jgi:hypothetical protein
MNPQEALNKIGQCQTQVGLPVFKFKRKEVQVLQGLIDTVHECVKLLEQEGINSKGLVKNKLEELIK